MEEGRTGVSRRETPTVRPLFVRDFRTAFVNDQKSSIYLSMLPSTAMEPREELEQLMTRQATLKRELKARKKELQDAQRRQRDNLQKQIRRSQARVSADDRRRRTRRLILIGSYMEHVTQSDPDSKARLMKGLDSFLERERDRELFGLGLQKEATPPLSPRPG